MAELYYRIGKKRYLIKECMFGGGRIGTVDDFFELYGEDDIINAVYEKTPETDFRAGALEVDYI